jgi:hypothetical protein
VRRKASDATSTRERELNYLLAEEKEERGERRGLEQRAAGLVAALLIAFPISATVAREADTSDPLAVVGLGVLALILLIAVAQAAALTTALGEPKRERFVVRDARVRVADALGKALLDRAVGEQRTIVETIRTDNAALVRKVRKVTAMLPVTLAGLLVGLALLVLAKHAPTSHSQPSPPSRSAPASPSVQSPATIGGDDRA